MKQKNGWWEGVILAIYIIGYLTMSVTLALTQPHIDTVSEQELSPPDEAARILVPEYICKHGTLPTGFEEEVRVAPYGFSYALYNTFPYIVQGYTMRLVSNFTDDSMILLYSARLVNIMFGLFMCIVVYLLGKRAFSDRRFRWIFCFSVTFLPQALFLHTYVNTDSCAMLSTAMIVYGLYWAYREEFNLKNSLWIAFGVVLCSLSYYNAYGYILCAIFLFFAFYMKREKAKLVYDYKKMLPNLWVILTVVAVGAGWWFIRSFIVLDGDILGLSTLVKMKDLYGDPSIASSATYKAQGVGLLEMIRENMFFTCAYQSFIAAFGSLSIIAYDWVYQFYKLFFGGGLLLCILFLITTGYLRKQNGKRIFFHANMVLCMIIPLILLIRYAYTMDYQAQGRYLMPALIPLMFYMAKGYEYAGKLSIRGKVLPERLVTLGSVLVIVLIISGCATTVFVKSLPLYLAIR